MVTYESPMSQVRFETRLHARALECHSWLCVGIDPDLAWLPAHLPKNADGVVTFARSIIESTAEWAAAFKLNFAFFEVLGAEGWAALEAVRTSIPDGIPVIADAKRGDIGNTDLAYARAILEVLEFDAVTVSPYLGWDSVEPFLAYPGKAAFVLCKTSNPGSGDLQDLPVDGRPLYWRVARGALDLGARPETAGEVALVMGATYPDALREVRTEWPDALFLVVGVGAQGAAAHETARVAANDRGDNALIGVSRQILRASSSRDFASAAGRAAKGLAAETWLA